MTKENNSCKLPGEDMRHYHSERTETAKQDRAIERGRNDST
ncbi:MAG: hypothetical protein QM644_09865 [Mobilitalea sp.]